MLVMNLPMKMGHTYKPWVCNVGTAGLNRPQHTQGHVYWPAKYTSGINNMVEVYKRYC